MVSFRGQKKRGLRPDLSPLGVSFKISDEHPHPFHMRSSPPPGKNSGRNSEVSVNMHNYKSACGAAQIFRSLLSNKLHNGIILPPCGLKNER